MHTDFPLTNGNLSENSLDNDNDSFHTSSPTVSSSPVDSEQNTNNNTTANNNIDININDNSTTLVSVVNESSPTTAPEPAPTTTSLIKYDILNDSHFNSNLNVILLSLQTEIFDNIMDNLIISMIFEIYKTHGIKLTKIYSFSNSPDAPIKIENNFNDEPIPNGISNDLSVSTKIVNPNNSGIIDNSRADLFGSSLNAVRKWESSCPNCSRTLAAFRFAPHLEKCLGTGRISSRIATKRITQVIKTSNGID